MNKWFGLGALLLSLQLSAATELTLNDYQDMDCQTLIHAQIKDDFVAFARHEIVTMIEADYCELRALGHNEKNFDGPESDRAGVSDAAHSKLIEGLYREFLGL